ncbi:right-handed parallel beta-helix repeat-containing protein [Candidatus Woesearchaeota archaeon]|nr:right-handed parallel beta-helix repeat-containing protein [Candidatus Woesearchaeota archaeon]
MRLPKKKFGQSSLEFVMITSVMFLIFMGTVMVIQGKISGAQQARLYASMEGLANVVNTEIRMAHSVQGDYSRKFSLPWNVEGYNYSISLYNKTEIIITTPDFDYVVFLDQNVSGAIGKGRNLIKKENDNISIRAIDLEGPSELCEGGAGTDDDDCEEINCSGWYNKTGTQGAYASDVQSCYNKENITDDRCEDVGDCKDANTIDCDAQDNDVSMYTCEACQFIAASNCTGNVLGACSNYPEGTPCAFGQVCDGNGGCGAPSGGVSYWAFEGGYTDSWDANDGQEQDDAHNISEGRCGQGVSFDGEGDYVTMGNNNNLNFNGGFTVVTWFNSKDVSDMQTLYYSYLNNSAVIQFRVRNSRLEVRTDISASWTDYLYVTGSQILLDNTWYHAAFVLNESREELTLYLNGTFDGSSSGTAVELFSASYTDIGGRSQYFNGTIDEVKIYNRSLNITEIQQIYQDDMDNCALQLGDTYYVAKSGCSDSGPGTESEPWCTIQKAANTLQAGETVFIKAGTYNEQVSPVNSGTEDNYITYSAYQNDIVSIVDNYFPIYVLGDKSYLKFANLELQAIGNNDWSAAFRARESGSTAPHHLILENLTLKGEEPMSADDRQFGVLLQAFETPITDITIKNCQVINNNHHGIFVYGMIYRVDIGPNNHISNNGWGLGSPETPHYAHGIEIHSEYPGNQTKGARDIKIFENEIDHNDMQGIRPAWCRRIHIKDNYLHYNGATGINLENQVNESVIENNIAEYNVQVYSYETGTWLDESNYVVIQNNIFRHNKFGFMTQGSSQIIIRNNEIYENNRGVSDIYQAQGAYIRWGTYDNILVHNTFYENCDQTGAFGDLTIGRVNNVVRPTVKNNIISEANCLYDLWVNLETDYTSDYNNYYNTKPLNINWKDSAMNWPQYVSASGQDTHSINENPLFENPGSGNFNLQSNSPCIDKGTFLTTVTSSSGSGTSLQVEDARYFTDGMGIIEGDLIKVGTNPLNRITDVDYSTNTITLEQSITWNNGDAVTYPYYGTAPDIGAIEYNETIPTGEVSYWAFEGNLDDAWPGSNNGGTLESGATYSTGMCGQGVKLDGVGAYVQIPENDNLDMRTNNFTIALWVNTSDTSLLEVLLIKEESMGSYRLRKRTNGVFRVDINDGVNSVTSTNDGTAFDDGEWHHLAVVFDRSAGTMTRYLDGSVNGSINDISSVGDIDNNDGMEIGSDDGSDNFLTGTIDEVKIYNRTLSAIEIQQMYQNDVDTCVPPPPPPTGEVAYWALDGNEQDQWGGNTGDLYGTPSYVVGKCDQNLRFDSDDDYMEVSGFHIPNETGERTVMAWVKILEEDAVTFNMHFIVSDSAENSPVDDNGISLLYRYDDFWVYAYDNNEDRSDIRLVDNPNPDSWYHLAVVHNNTDLIGYVNGSVVGTTPCIGSILCTKPFRIGNFGNGYSHFGGIIDEVKIYNKSLSESEIQAIYQDDMDNCLPPPPPPSEVAYFKFDGNYLDEWNNNHGNPVGNPSFGTGQCSQGVELDAAESDYVNVPDENLDFEAPDHTLMAWVNFNNWAGSNTDVIFANSGLQWTGSLSLYRTSSDDMRFVVRDTSGATTARDVQQDVSSLSGWHHVAAVISTQNPVSGSNYMELYIDGSNAGNFDNGNADGIWTPDTGLDFKIGASTQGSGGYADGTIDEVKIFNRTLSQAEIVAEMNCP